MHTIEPNQYAKCSTKRNKKPSNVKSCIAENISNWEITVLKRLITVIIYDELTDKSDQDNRNVQAVTRHNNSNAASTIGAKESLPVFLYQKPIDL